MLQFCCRYRGALGQPSGQALPAQPEVAFGAMSPFLSSNHRPPAAHWFVKSTVGPESLDRRRVHGCLSTATNSPREYGPHWEGFGKRYGMRLTRHLPPATPWKRHWAPSGEKTRAISAPPANHFKERIKNVIVMTFAARRADGNLAPAYARYLGTAGNNFLSNTWRPTASPA